MAKLLEIWNEIENGKGFKRSTWNDYFYLKDGHTSAIFTEDIFKDDWELKPDEIEEE